MTAHKNTLPFAQPVSLSARSLFLPGGDASLPNPNQAAKIRMVSGTVSDFNRCIGVQSELCEGPGMGAD
jgi:hypothetical protein